MGIKRTKGKFQFKSNKADFIKFKRKAPSIIANQSLNHFLKGFKIGGHQTDASKGGWQKRKLRTRDFTGGKKTRQKARRSVGRAILVDRGHLKRDVQKLKVSFREIWLGTRTIDYARRHNEGITDKLGRAMPKREFMGDSRELTKKNVGTIEKMVNKVMRV